MKSLSIIIPVYKAENQIEKCIKSIIEQEDYGIDYEIIAVIDNSPDNSKKIIEDIKSNKIKIIDLEENVGAAQARNIGYASSIGEWIFFVDNDDVVLDKLFYIFKNDIIQDFDIYLFDYEVDLGSKIMECKINFIDKRNLMSPGVVWNKILKRDIFIDFNKDTVEDFIWNAEILLKNFKIKKINKKIYRLNRIMSNSYSFNMPKEKIYNSLIIANQNYGKDDIYDQWLLQYNVYSIVKQNITLRFKIKLIFWIFKNISISEYIMLVKIGRKYNVEEKEMINSKNIK